MDRVLETAEALHWPTATAKALSQGLTELSTQFGIALLEGQSGQLSLPLPRRSTPPHVVSLLMGGQGTNSSVLSEMATRWVELATLAGFAEGFVGTHKDWIRWEEAVPELAVLKWSRSQRRSFEVRTPPQLPGRKLGAWPVCRWALLLTWLVDRVLETRAVDGSISVSH